MIKEGLAFCIAFLLAGILLDYLGKFISINIYIENEDDYYDD